MGSIRFYKRRVLGYTSRIMGLSNLDPKQYPPATLLWKPLKAPEADGARAMRAISAG